MLTPEEYLRQTEENRKIADKHLAQSEAAAFNVRFWFGVPMESIKRLGGVDDKPQS